MNLRSVCPQKIVVIEKKWQKWTIGNKNIEGIIVGKAIYDGDIKLEELAKEIDA